MTIFLGFACVFIFLIWACTLEMLTRRRLYRFAQAKRMLRNAVLWLSLDYTLGKDDSKQAQGLLKCALIIVESDELNFRVEEGLTR